MKGESLLRISRSKCLLTAIALAGLLVGCSGAGTVSGLDGHTGTVRDADGNEYSTVGIGQQWWMAENLRVTHYRNGEPIPNVVDEDEWPDLTTGACSAYDNDLILIATYGLLYNWYAVDDSRGVCPEGWHVPSDEEWKELEMHLGMSETEVDSLDWRGSDEGGKLKEAGTQHWESPNTGATNETGFSAVPSGGRASDGYFGGKFFYRGSREGYWSSSEQAGLGLQCALWSDQPGIRRCTHTKATGLPVRCVKH